MEMLVTAVDPNAGLSNVKLLIIAGITIVLFVVTFFALLKAFKGNLNVVAKIIGATLIALIPAGIGATIGAIALGSSIVDFILPTVTK